jgi:hypothetical protein
LFILQKIKDINFIESRETYKADLLFFQSQRLNYMATGKNLQGLKSWSEIIQKVETPTDDRTAAQIETDTLKLFENWGERS